MDHGVGGPWVVRSVGGLFDAERLVEQGACGGWLAEGAQGVAKPGQGSGVSWVVGAEDCPGEGYRAFE